MNRAGRQKSVHRGVLSTAAIAVDHVIPGVGKAIGEAAGCEVTAIASRATERAAAVAVELGIPRAHGSYQEMLEDPQVDCVYIGLSNSMHVEWALRAAMLAFPKQRLSVMDDTFRRRPWLQAPPENDATPSPHTAVAGDLVRADFGEADHA